jgi:hypothetical protein
MFIAAGIALLILPARVQRPEEDMEREALEQSAQPQAMPASTISAD